MKRKGMPNEEPRFKNKKRIGRIFAGILVAAMFFGVIELTTRTVSCLKGKGFTLSLHEMEPYDKAVETIYAWHPFIGITMRPNCGFVGSHPNQKEQSSILVDKHGFLAKDQSLVYEKETNEIRIATIGASTTANINLTYDENWPGRLGTLMENALPNKKIRVINAAIPGCDTAQSIGNLALRVMPFKPDIIIIYHGYNDLKAIRSDIPFKPDYTHIHSTPFGFYRKPNVLVRSLNHSMFFVRTRQKLRDYKMSVNTHEKLSEASLNKNRLSHIPNEASRTFGQHIRILISIAKSEGAIVVIPSFATLHDLHLKYSEREVFEQLSELRKVELRQLMHFTPGLTIEAIFDGIDQYNGLLKQIAIDEGALWIDNASLIPHENRYFVDRVHFTKEGANRMARNLLPAIVEKLERQ